MSQAARRAVYLATLDQQIIETFELEKAFHIFTDRATESVITRENARASSNH